MSYANKMPSGDPSVVLVKNGWHSIGGDGKTTIFIKPLSSTALAAEDTGKTYVAVQLSGSLDHVCGPPVFKIDYLEKSQLVTLDRTGKLYLIEVGDDGPQIVSRNELSFNSGNAGQIYSDMNTLVMVLSGLKDPVEAVDARMPDSIRNDLEFPGVPRISDGHKIPKRVMPVYNEKGKLVDVKKEY